MIKPQTYCHLPLADLKSQNFFQSRVNSGKINEEFYKPIIENDIKEQLKIIILLIYLILKMKILKLN